MSLAGRKAEDHPVSGDRSPVSGYGVQGADPEVQRICGRDCAARDGPSGGENHIVFGEYTDSGIYKVVKSVLSKFEI